MDENVRRLVTIFGYQTDGASIARARKSWDGVREAWGEAGQSARRLAAEAGNAAVSGMNLASSAAEQNDEAEETSAKWAAVAAIWRRARAVSERLSDSVGDTSSELREQSSEATTARDRWAALSGTWGRVGRVARNLTVAAGGAAVAGVALATTTAQQGAEANRVASTIGLTTEAYQEWAHAARSTGADIDDVADVFSTLSDRALDVRQGSQGMIDDFAAIGLGAEDLENKSPEEIFYLVADGIASLETDADRVGMTVRLLGDDVGRRMAPMMREGSEGIADLREEAQRLGVVMSDDAVSGSEDFMRSLNRGRAAITGIRNSIGSALMPVIERVVDTFSEWVSANKDAIDSNIEQWVESLTESFDRLEPTLDRVMDAFTFVGDAIAWVIKHKEALGLFALWGSITLGVSTVLGLAAGLQVLAAAFGTTGNAALIAQAKIFMIGAVIAGIAVGLWLFVDDFKNFLAGNDSLIGDWVDSWIKGGGKVEGVMDRVALALDGMRTDGSQAMEMFAGDVAYWVRYFIADIERGIANITKLAGDARQLAVTFGGLRSSAEEDLAAAQRAERAADAEEYFRRVRSEGDRRFSQAGQIEIREEANRRRQEREGPRIGPDGRPINVGGASVNVGTINVGNGAQPNDIMASIRTVVDESARKQASQIERAVR